MSQKRSLEGNHKIFELNKNENITPKPVECRCHSIKCLYQKKKVSNQKFKLLPEANRKRKAKLQSKKEGNNKGKSRNQ